VAWDILGDEFCSILVPGLQVFGLRAILHSIGDGVLFVIGVQLCRDLLPRTHFEQFAWSELAVMMVWGNLQELAVDLTGQGWIWDYNADHWANTVMFNYNGVPYTLAPQLVWVFAPLFFYLSTIYFAARQEYNKRLEKEKEA